MTNTSTNNTSTNRTFGRHSQVSFYLINEIYQDLGDVGIYTDEPTMDERRRQ
jgi:hypothetical protein